MGLSSEYDVVVAGGGTAGCAAAIAASSDGCKVLLVEESNALGGCSTTGLVNEWFANTEGLGSIFSRIFSELEKSGLFCKNRMFNGELLKAIWLVHCIKADVNILFHASVAGVIKRQKKIKGIKIVSCSQEIFVKAKYFIDATGEGDLAALAGADYMKGDNENNNQLHMSLMFQMVKSATSIHPYLPEELTPYKSIEETPGLRVHHPMEDGRIYCNMTKVMGYDSTDPYMLSAAEIEARIQLIKIVYLLQTTILKNYIPVASGAKIGIREGRRIAGDYILKTEDILGNKKFTDGTVVATSQIDFHSLTRPGKLGWRKEVKPYSIPFRCLYSKDFDNLFMAGKCISTEQIAHSSCRMTPTCCGMGQTVGIAAAIAVKRQLDNIRELNVCELQTELTRNDFELSPEKHNPFHIKGAEGNRENCI
jgi:hypothetical protein